MNNYIGMMFINKTTYIQELSEYQYILLNFQFLQKALFTVLLNLIKLFCSFYIVF